MVSDYLLGDLVQQAGQCLSEKALIWDSEEFELCSVEPGTLNLTVGLSSRDIWKILKMFWDITASSAAVLVSDHKPRSLKQPKSIPFLKISSCSESH